ncbi:MAG: transferase hexapeptide repeat family protein [Bacteroidetes bacterium]|nr:MAG: transferase hexapeptide repeat family protein [Bacteroidota bacterium]
MAVFSFNGFIPVIKASSFVHPQANVTGNVIIGEDVYIGPGAVIRGDWGQIIIEDGCNVQENCVIHMFPGTTVLLKKGAHIGHGAIIHGGTIGENSLIGMNSVVMDDVVIEEECIIGALSFIPGKTHIPKRSLVVGNPGKIIKEVSDEMIAWKTKGTQLYQALPAECHQSLKEVQPLREIEENRPTQEKLYETWNKIKGD